MAVSPWMHMHRAKRDLHGPDNQRFLFFVSFVARVGYKRVGGTVQGQKKNV